MWSQRGPLPLYSKETLKYTPDSIATPDSSRVAPARRPGETLAPQRPRPSPDLSSSPPGKARSAAAAAGSLLPRLAGSGAGGSWRWLAARAWGRRQGSRSRFPLVCVGVRSGRAAAVLGMRWRALGSRRRSGVCRRRWSLCVVGGSVSDPDGAGDGGGPAWPAIWMRWCRRLADLPVLQGSAWWCW